MQLNNVPLFVVSISILVSGVLGQYPPDRTKVIADLKNIRRDTIELSYDLASFLADPCTQAATFTDHLAYVNRYLNLVPVDLVAGEPWDDPNWSGTVAGLAQGYLYDGTVWLDTLISNVTAMADWEKELVLGYLQDGNTAMVNMWTALINELGASYFSVVTARIDELKALWLNAISVYS